MKNFKASAALLSVIFITGILYFSVTGASTGTSFSKPSIEVVKTDAENPNALCTIAFAVASADSSCLSGSYKVCVNGGTPVTLGNFFTLDLECGGTYTICVNSTSGCSGTLVNLNVPCPCQSIGRQTITISSETQQCMCQ